MTVFFQFEADFVDSLRCIPMQVRMNLDTCGVKLKLSHWHQFTSQECQLLVSMSCATPEESKIYRDFLQHLVTEKTGAPAGELPIDSNPPWMDIQNIPITVQEKAAEFDVNINLEQWQKLTPLQRFALMKLSRPSHENRNFYPALQEFGLLE
jgi:hypothetical protein